MTALRSVAAPGVLALALGTGTLPSAPGGDPWSEQPWSARVIDAARGGRTAVADVNGDGRPDVVLHEWRSKQGEDGSLAWYDGRTGERHLIRRDQYFGDAIVARDLDGDGDVDVVAPTGSYGRGDLVIHEQVAGEWLVRARLRVDRKAEIKDLECVDLDHDGRLDLVARGKEATVLLFQDARDGWTERRLETRPREGLALGDLDGDGDEDLVLNGFWLETPQDPRAGEYVEHTIDPAWYTDDTGKWQDFSVMVGTGDLDGDGRLDVVIGQSEKPGVEVCWYGRGEGDDWTRTSLGVCDWCHSLAVDDFDADGWPDVLVGETKRNERAVLRVLRNRGAARRFERRDLPIGPSYRATVADADGDGDLDVVQSASWVDGPLRVLENPLRPVGVGPWRRHELASLPARAPFVDAADVDGDGDLDLVAGAHWYVNPGRMDAAWTKRAIGAPMGSAAIVRDLDGDGAVDVFGTRGVGSQAERRLVFARGVGDGNFEVRADLPAGPPSDFLQGRAAVRGSNGWELLLSWHSGEGGVQRVRVPEDVMGGTWSTDEASKVTLNEDIALADVDGDGDLDALLGTRWLRRDGESYTPFELGSVDDLEPTRGGSVATDRLALADLDGDGRLDLIAGCEAAQEILWFAPPADPTGPWTRRVIARVPGEGYSLGAGDVDLDGDPDIVIGEHRAGPNRVFVLENASGDGARFVAHVADDGRGEIDHHDGTLPVDLDGDGDLDIVSIGWTHPTLWVIENLAIDG